MTKSTSKTGRGSPGSEQNVLTKYLEKIDKSKTMDSSGSDSAHSTMRFMRASQSLDEKSFVKARNLPRKCFQVIKKYPELSTSSEILRELGTLTSFHEVPPSAEYYGA